ncbi:hypothetical protein HYS00_03005 [Candidatus Microgenomates bacterium]|nr:hypothetical protein [Candidatus Microgenomates bacterium]
MDSPSAQFQHLKQKWTARHNELEHAIHTKHASALDTLKHVPQNLLVGALAGILTFAFSPPVSFAQLSPPHENKITVEHTRESLVKELSSLLPAEVQPLNADQDSQIGSLLSVYFKMPVWAVLGGFQLNRTYGYIGAEQHLTRYPGDTMDTHFATPEDAATGASGMAPGRGAWGYFAESGGALTQRDIDREKYYIAVQTFLAPGWDENNNELYKFFKFRKMLIVNPDNGHAMVVVIGDAGPSPHTGKHLGGSPEVMKYLERYDGAQKGPVLYYFIDDPEDKIPLGPITIAS